jgi:hypothetical protein
MRHEASPSGATPRPQKATLRAADVASAQWGVISLQQLRDCGVSQSVANRWRWEGRMHTIHRGIYALGHSSVPVEGRLVAALLHAGPEAVLSHRTAAWWWGMLDREPGVIDVSAPGRHRSLNGVRVHHPRVLDATRTRRLPVTTVARTLRDAASRSSAYEVRRMLAQADYRGLLVFSEVEAVCGAGRPGSARLMAALQRHEPRIALTRSELERRFLDLCEAGGIPLPEVNVQVEGWTVDMLWRSERVIVELDGRDNHSSPGQLERDRRKDLHLRRARYVVLRYTWAQVTFEAGTVTADVTATLSSAAQSAARGSR